MTTPLNALLNAAQLLADVPDFENNHVLVDSIVELLTATGFDVPTAVLIVETAAEDDLKILEALAAVSTRR